MDSKAGAWRRGSPANFGQGTPQVEKEEAGGDASSLARRLAYKRGEFNLRRYPQEKLYPSSSAGQPMFPGLPNLAIVGSAVLRTNREGWDDAWGSVTEPPWNGIRGSSTYRTSPFPITTWRFGFPSESVKRAPLEVQAPGRAEERTVLPSLEGRATRAGAQGWGGGRGKGKTFTRPTSVVHWAVETEVAEGRKRGRGFGPPRCWCGSRGTRSSPWRKSKYLGRGIRSLRAWRRVGTARARGRGGASATRTGSARTAA